MFFFGVHFCLHPKNPIGSRSSPRLRATDPPSLLGRARLPQLLRGSARPEPQRGSARWSCGGQGTSNGMDAGSGEVSGLLGMVVILGDGARRKHHDFQKTLKTSKNHTFLEGKEEK